MATILSVNGQLGTYPSRQLSSGVGSYFTATNPTAGTGVQYALKTAFSTTANGLFTISNGNPLTNGNKIYLDTLRLMMTGTAPTATLSMVLHFWTEAGIVAPSAGNAVITAVSPNAGTANSATGATVNFFTGNAAMTIPAAVGARRFQGATALPTNLGITGDTYVVQFGAMPASANTPLTAARGSTASASIIGDAPPIVIPPGYTAIASMFWLTQATAGAFFEYNLSYFEG